MFAVVSCTCSEQSGKVTSTVSLRENLKEAQEIFDDVVLAASVLRPTRSSVVVGLVAAHESTILDTRVLGDNHFVAEGIPALLGMSLQPAGQEDVYHVALCRRQMKA